MSIDDTDRFSYTPECHERGCEAPAVYKVAAPWSDGTSRELKNYGLACERHARPLLDRARRRRDGLILAEGESVGRVSLYRLDAGSRDVELAALDDEATPEPA